MAVMGSAPWTPQDQAMQTGSEEDFNQFVDMGGMSMSGLAEQMPYEFHGFSDASNAAQILSHHQAAAAARATTAASAVDMAGVNVRVDQSTHGQQQTPSPADTISQIDAQIQFLQRERAQQQQRQILKHQPGFYGRPTSAQQQPAIPVTTSAPSHEIPPTPQSLKLAPVSDHFYTTGADHCQPPPRSQSQTPSHQTQSQRQSDSVYDSTFSHIGEQQDLVGVASPFL